MLNTEITVKPEQFKAAVGWAAKWVTSKPVVPIQGGLMLAVDAATGLLTISAYGENVSARTSLDIIDGGGPDGNRIEGGQALVSGRLLAELAATFGPGKNVTIGGGEKELVLAAGKFRATLPLMDAGDWTTLPDALPTVGVVDGDAMARAVATVGVATKKVQEGMAALFTIHVGFGEQLELIASDRYRGATALVPWTTRSHDVPDVAPLSATLIDAAGAFAGPGEVTIGCDGKVLSLSNATRALTMRLMDIEGGWPAPLFRGQFHAETTGAFTVARGDLAMPLKRAALVRGKEGPVRVRLDDGTLTIAATQADIGNASGEEVAVGYEGEPIDFAFNPKYLGEALASAPGDTVTVGFTEPRRPLVLTCDDDKTWRHLLMPLAI